MTRASPLHTIAWLRKPGATDRAGGTGELATSAPRPTGKVTSLELAQQLLEHGADPNVRVDWQEIKFEPLGGTTRNPPGLFLGRHLLTYNGATAFYVAAKNGDHEYMRLLAEGGADPIDHEPLRGHAADGRRGPRYLGRRDAGPAHGDARGRAARSREARHRARQRRQRGRRLRRLSR